MKVLCFCMSCLNNSSVPCLSFDIFPLTERNAYLLECPNGGLTITSLQNHKFEILSEMGLLCFHNGDYDLCVLRLHTALERFYELCAKVVYFEVCGGFSDFSKVFEPMKNNSESQRGAFHFAVAVSEAIGKKTWPKIDNLSNLGALRNKVIHAGKLPTRDEALKHGEVITNFMQEIIDFLKVNKDEIWKYVCADEIRLATIEQNEIKSKHIGKEVATATGTVHAQLSLATGRSPKRSFVDLAAAAKEAEQQFDEMCKSLTAFSLPVSFSKP